MADKVKKGVFITLEGPEGSGKSTQARMLAKCLENDGYSVVLTSEPGATPLGEKIREILLLREDVCISPLSELFLFQADRAQHIQDVIVPSLDAGKVVICDRFSAATYAYQGYGLGLDSGLIKLLDGAVRSGVEPDLVVVLDIPPEEGFARVASRGKSSDRMEKRSIDFHKKVRKGYLEMSAKDPVKMKVVDARGDLSSVHEKIKEMVYGVIS